MPAPSDIVYQQSTTAGTGNLSLAAVNGRRTFAAAFGTGATPDVFDYFITASNGSSSDEWERGTGHMSNSTTLVRDTVIASSNSNSLVNFSGGILDVTNDIPAGNQVYSEGSTVTDGDTAGFDGTTGRKIKSVTRGRNLVINPSGQYAQPGVASSADGAYTGIDQWYVLTQSNAVTPSQLTAVENGTPYMMRITQANASAQRFGLAQPFEAAMVADLRGKAVSLRARVRMSASTTLRWAVLEWTGTADSPTKDVVNSWTNTTFTTGNFFISTTTTLVATGSIALTANTLTDLIANNLGSISGSMNNLILFFWTDSTQAQNVTLDIGNVWLGQGASAPPRFELPPADEDMRRCQRYYEQTYPYGTAPGTAYGTPSGGAAYSTFVWATNSFNPVINWQFKVTKRTSPTVTGYSPYTGTSGKARDQNGGVDVNTGLTGTINQVTSLVNNVSVTFSNYVFGHAVADARL